MGLAPAPSTATNVPRGEVRLRAWRTDDVALLASLMTDPDVRRFVGGPLDPAQAAERAAAIASSAPWGYFVIEEDGRPVGTLTFDRKRGPWEVSFQLQRSAWGRGVMTAALELGVVWFREQEPEEPLIAVTQEANIAARRTITRCGGTAVERFEQYGLAQIRYDL